MLDGEMVRRRHWYTYIHLWLGRIFIPLLMANCGFGLLEAQVSSKWAAVWRSSCGGLVAMYFSVSMMLAIWGEEIMQRASRNCRGQQIACTWNVKEGVKRREQMRCRRNYKFWVKGHNLIGIRSVHSHEDSDCYLICNLWMYWRTTVCLLLHDGRYYKNPKATLLPSRHVFLGYTDYVSNFASQIKLYILL